MFVLNAKCLCDHYLMKTTQDKLSGKILLFLAVEHMKQSLKPVSLLVLFVFLEIAVLVTVGSCESRFSC